MQEAKLKSSRDMDANRIFVEDAATVKEKGRGIQRPRAFYRRELEAQPLIVAKP
jgi:hypothetical protein